MNKNNVSKSKKNRKKKRWIIPVAIVAAGVLLAVFVIMPAFMASNFQASAADAVTRTATAETGTIEVSVVGSGNLEASGQSYVKVPSVLSVSEVLVEAGDTVSAGDTLATLDPAALSDAISQTQAEIASLDEQIETAAEEDDAAEITTSVSGRVKKIYAQAGDDVTSVIAGSGSLMVLSVDGKMSVEIPSSSLAVGDDVVVQLPGGDEYDGEVAGVSGERCKITLSDNGPEVDSSVTVLSTGGDTLGTGTLLINAPLEILTGSGTVASVDVDENESVSAGDTLLTLEETSGAQDYESLMRERQNYANVLRLLLAYAQTDTIVADTGGVIGEVLIESDSDASSASSSSDSAGSGQYAGMSYDATDAQADTLEYSGVGSSALVLYDTVSLLSAAPAASPGSVTVLAAQLDVALAQPVAGEVPQTQIATQQGLGYTGTVLWSPEAQQFAPQTQYTATVTLKADTGYVFDAATTVTVPGATIDPLGVTVSTEAEQNTLTFTAVFSETGEAAQTVPAGQDAGQATQQPDQAVDQSAMQGAGGVSSGVGASSSASSSAALGASDASSSDSSASDDSSSEASLMQNAFSFLSDEVNSMTVSIDELDILELATGQEASVVLDALPDETFTGTVTKVSSSGTAQSGVTTYPVTITIDFPEGTAVMAGMNATATIITAVSEDALLIPMSALQEMGNEQFVLVMSETENATEEDGTTMQGEQRSVTTGLSDGTNVEILSGLEAGEVVVYTEVTSTDSEDMMVSMQGMGGGMMMGGTGEMPDMSGGGGNMPDMGGGFSGGPPS